MGEYNPVNEMKLWKDRVEGEYAVAAEWETNWGFLKACNKGKQSLHDGATSSAADGAESSAVGPSAGGAAGAADTVVTEQDPNRVPLDASAQSPKTKSELGEDTIAMTSKLRYTVNRGKSPKEKQSRPSTTSQEIGWRPSVELFGISSHGIRRDPGIWPQ